MEYPDYRLFDAIAYQLKHFEKPDALNAKINGRWKPYSTKEVADMADKLSAGLLKKGVSGGHFTAESSDKIGIVSNSRPEWVITDLAVQQTGAILVPIYPTTNTLEMEYILNQGEVKFLFVGNRELFEKARAMNIPSLQSIYCFDEIAGCDHYSELIASADADSLEKVAEIKSHIPADHIATIIYTSGTTGMPKGVMLSHANIISNLFLVKAFFPYPEGRHLKMLSFLPLNHIFEKLGTYMYFFCGASIYYAENIDTIANDLLDIKPDSFTTVPRLLEKVYEKIMFKGASLKGIKRLLFFWSVRVGNKYNNRKKQGLFYHLQLRLARKLVFSKWREALGGNIKFIIAGGAAVPKRILRMFHAAGIPVYEGYGPTEHSPIISANRRVHNEVYFGTVGLPIDGVEVKLADDGEILVKSPCVMKGYYKHPELTAEAIKEGWLYTGDVGKWVEGKYLKITDRKKELFKTSGGKYVAPQPIETRMKESKFIEQILVVGNHRKFVGALIVPTFEMVREWLKEQNITTPMTNEEVIRHEEVQKLFHSVVAHHNRHFNHVEKIKKFELLPREWSIENGEMTPKLSPKRKVIEEKYKKQIERIYGG
ncbi:MAG: long-chain fatty acid--CoA ligase [Niabella sp.]